MTYMVVIYYIVSMLCYFVMNGKKQEMDEVFLIDEMLQEPHQTDPLNPVIPACGKMLSSKLNYSKHKNRLIRQKNWCM